MSDLRLCFRCEQPITDDDPHSDPETGDDVHEACCASCHPDLAERWGLELDVTTDVLRHSVDVGSTVLRDDDGQPLISGHGGGLTQDQAARGEALWAAHLEECG